MHFGDCNFSAACPGFWNNLPPDRCIRLAVSVDLFKARLKTYLFAKAYFFCNPLLVRIAPLYPPACRKRRLKGVGAQ